jgi:putative CocE/NonD family hydrolase
MKAMFGVLFLCGGLTVQRPVRDEVVHSFGYIPMTDGAQISYTLYRPEAAKRYPTLLLYNMYDASAVRPDWNQTVSTEVSDYLDAGYAVIGANVRGSACSTGRLDPLDAEQVGRDGAEVVEWIARQPWSDGAVGMFGHSGSGITQFYVAARNPAPLKAVIPGAAPADLYRDIGYPGGLFNYVFFYMWAERAQPAQAELAARAHIAAGDRQCAERLNRQANPTFEEMKKRPLDDRIRAFFLPQSGYSTSSQARRRCSWPRKATASTSARESSGGTRSASSTDG